MTRPCPRRKGVVIAAEILPPQIGGPATYVAYLSQALVECGSDVRIVSYGREFTPLPTVSIQLVRSHGGRLRRGIAYVWQLWTLTPKGGCIFAQGLVAAGLPALIVSWLRTARLVVRVPGDYAWETAHRLGVVSVGPLEFQEQHCRGRIRWLCVIERLVARRANAVIVPSAGLRDLARRWGVSAGRLHIMPNSVRYRPRAPNTRAACQERIGVNGDLIVAVGRMIPLKGFGSIVRAIAPLLRTDSRLKLVLVGDGPTNAELRSLAARLGVQRQVVFAGACPQEKVCEYLTAAFVLVVNSLVEGCPHTILEAMQAGTPVVASRVPGNTELIQNGVDGLLFEHDDEDGMSRHVVAIRADPQFANDLAERAKARVARFTFDDMVRQVVPVLFPCGPRQAES